MELIGVETLISFVETVLYSGKIKNESPLSVLLIATPECGKTSSISTLILESKCKTAVPLTDVTGTGILKLCKECPDVTHFIFNDLVAVMAHRESANRYTLSMMMAVTEEGVQMIANPGGIERFQNGKRGIIACTTPKMAKDKRQWFNWHGLSSRMIPFYYDHSEILQIRIKDAIETKLSGKKVRKVKHKKDGKEIRLRIPKNPVNVTIPSALSRKIRRMAEEKALYLSDPKGYRRLKQYLGLAKSRALSRGRKEVNSADLEWLETISPFISYSKAHPL